MSIRSRIVRQCPCLGKILRAFGYEFKNCIMCCQEGKPQDMDNFVHCSNDDCSAIYCLSCFEDLNNHCTMCLNPVDYGDISDQSEEADSSEDDEIVFAYRKRKAKERKEKINARRQRQSPKNVMSYFRSLFAVHKSNEKILTLDNAVGQSNRSEEGKLLDKTAGEDSSSSTSSSSTEQDDFDTSYQYAEKLGTSDSEDVDSTDDSLQKSNNEKIRNANFNDNKNINFWKSSSRVPEYVTVNIFDMSSSDEIECYKKCVR